jgi:hypothetical protein
MQRLAVGASGSLLNHIPLAAAALLVAFQFLPAKPVVTGPVANVLASASSADRKTVAAIYSALADVVERDKGWRINTTLTWRSVYADALALAAGGTDLVGKYKGLDKAIEEVLSQHYPLDNVAITPELAQKIADACREVVKQSGG